jgi:outer membrane beta-barrel protein
MIIRKFGLYIFAAVLMSLLGAIGTATPAIAADGPGIDALKEFRRRTKGFKPAVENRFFVKESRFEVAPIVGYVPNNSFAKRYVAGAVLAYHFTEVLAAESQITYSPDLGESDLKGLTTVLIDRAYNASAVSQANFQQPLDKVTLSAAFGMSWAPIYGKINLVGEKVLNFDMAGFAGVAMLSKSNYNAKYDIENANIETGDIVLLESLGNEVKIAPVIGIGMNFFLNQTVALKFDARSSLFVDNKPQYDPNEPVAQQRLYTNFITSLGLAFYFPKMKPRLYNF